MKAMPQKTSQERFPFLHDPVNSAPKTERGYPIRIPIYEGRIGYVATQDEREAVLLAQQGLFILEEAKKRPWWKKLWLSIKNPY